MKQQLRIKDLWWILAYPLYQLVGTFRHEASHALAAILEGAVIEEFVFWPTSLGWGRTSPWGYVNWSGPIGWVSLAAPYFCDLITFVVFFVVCTRLRFKRHWVWINLVIIGLISPLVNSVWNYKGALKPNGDVSALLGIGPSYLVHSYFVITLLVYSVGLFLVLRPKADLASTALRQGNHST